MTLIAGQLEFVGLDGLLREAAGLRDLRRVPASDGAARLLYAMAERGLPERLMAPAAALAMELDLQALEKAAGA